MNGLADDFSGRVSHAQDAGLTTEEGRKLRRQGWLAVMLLVMRVADLVVIWLSGLAAYTGRFGLVEVPGLVMLALTFAVMMSAVVFSLGRAYSAGEADNFWASASRVLGQWALVCLLLIAAVFMSGVAESYSRGWAALWMTTAALGLVGVRAAGATLMRRARARGSMVTRVAIIGGDESGLQLHHYLKQQGKHIEVVGIYDDRFARLQDAARAQGVTLLGTAQDFLKRARYESVDCVVINLPWSSEHRVREMVEVLQELAIEVQICPEGLNFVVQSFPLLKNSIATTLGGLPMFSVSRRPLDGWGWLIKDIEDRILITLLAPLVLPLCLLIAIAIKFDSPGPVLFRQRRKGFNGREFMVYKFRSMRAADSVPTGVTKATLRDDPRVTFVGNILRRTSLDELPQLFNVLRGEMSIIGPRPHAVDHDEQFARVIRQYYSRHRVRPGITGWAQVNGLRGTIEEDAQIRRRVAHDLWYIENWSVFFDLRILLMTPFVGLINRNAY